MNLLVDPQAAEKSAKVRYYTLILGGWGLNAAETPRAVDYACGVVREVLAG